MRTFFLYQQPLFDQPADEATRLAFFEIERLAQSLKLQLAMIPYRSEYARCMQRQA